MKVHTSLPLESTAAHCTSAHKSFSSSSSSFFFECLLRSIHDLETFPLFFFCFVLLCSFLHLSGVFFVLFNFRGFVYYCRKFARGKPKKEEHI